MTAPVLMIYMCSAHLVDLITHCSQADKLGVPLVEEDRSQYLALVNAGVSVSWDGRRIVAPPGVVDEQGMCDLEPYMPANFKKASKKQQ